MNKIIKHKEGDIKIIRAVTMKLSNRRIDCMKGERVETKEIIYMFRFRRLIDRKTRNINIQHIYLSHEGLCAVFDAFCMLNNDDLMDILEEFPKRNILSITKELKELVDKEG